MLDFIRIACAVPAVKVGDVKKNAEDICAYIEKADAANADLLVFPELALTGYSCGDLFFQDVLWKAVKEGLKRICECTQKCPALNVVVGLPIRLNSKLLNCAALIRDGGLRGIVPKTYLTDAEKRWFVSGADLKETAAGLDVFGKDEFGFVSLGTDLLIEIGDGAVVGIEICEDMNAPIPTSALLALNGANVIANLSASPDVAGKRAQRTDRVRANSVAGICIYAYASAGMTESTADQVFCGQSIIAENGTVLKENSNLIDSDYMIVQDCDLGRIRAERQKNSSFRQAAYFYGSREYLNESMLGNAQLRSDGSLYPVQKLPFIPATKAERDAYCKDVFRIQAAGLAQRLKTINSNAVIGISGGLDSTLALLVCVEAMRILGRPATDIYGVTMPCLALLPNIATNPDLNSDILFCSFIPQFL